jgi:signal transduction histidine kinase/ligand-binding sensor domain-containing protein/DNA-binding response OmpR family regulator
MKNKAIWYQIIITWLFFSLSESYGQQLDYHFKHLGERQGLSNNNVWSIIQDSEGFMWFGTLDGLNKYDGYSFEVFKPDPEDQENTLHHNIISDIHEDHKGRLWVTTFGGGFHQVDKQTCKVTRFEIRSNHTAFWNTLGSIFEDESGFLWISAVGGMARFDPDTHQFVLYPRPARNGMSLTSIEDDKGRFWVGHERGIFILDRENGAYNPILLDTTMIQQPGVWSLFLDSDDILWAGTNGEGLFYLDTRQEALRFTRFEGKVNKTFYWSFNGIYEDSQGYLWVSTEEGLQRINKRTKEVFSFPYNPTKPGSLSHERVKTVYQDPTGTLWVGTENGVNVAHANKFRSYQIVSTLPSVRLKENEIGSIVEDHTGMIWLTNSLFSRLDMKLYQFNPRTGQAKHIPIYLSKSGKQSLGKVLTVYEDENNRLWVGTSEALLLLDRNTMTFIQYLTNISVYCIDEDTSGTLWLGGNPGIASFDPKSSQFEYFLYDINDSTNLGQRNASRIHSSDVIDLTVSHTGEIWIGYLGSGVDRFNPMKGTFTHYLPDPDSPKGKLKDRDVRSLYEDDDGVIWVGTMLGGLNRFDPQTDSFEYFTVHDGLPDNHVASIISDTDGYLWLGTNHGISRFNTLTEEFRNYDITDGLPANHFQGGDAYRVNEKLMFGSVNGFTFFHPDSIRLNTTPPPVYITGFQVMEEEREVPAKAVELPYDENILSFDFVALNYNAPEKNQHIYMLEGVDKDWVYTNDLRVARYTNLSPGEYTFRVKASNNDGVWNEEGASLQLTILPPWWQTIGAYFLYGLMGIGLLFGLRQYTVKRERLKHELNLQRMEAEKMHTVDQMKSRFFANISHEFRTPLTLILGPLDKYIRQSEADSPERQTFQMMRRNARRLLHLINQLLDLSKLEAGRMQLNPSPQPIQSFLQPIGMSFSALAERKQITYHFRYPKENLVLYFDADKLEKIITNLLSNAFKFTPAGEEIIFTACLKPGKNKYQSNGNTTKQILVLEVKDSGAGMDEEQVEHIFQRFYQAHSTHDTDTEGSGIGLSLVKELVELHGGEIAVTSERGAGSCFTVSLLLQEADFAEFVSQSSREVEIPVLDNEHDNRAGSETETPEEGATSLDAPLLLLVEDNADVRTFISESLKASYRLLEASNGREGYQIAIETIPDLVLSDVMMPEMDGVALCARLKADEKTAHVPVVLLTAKASGGDKIEGLQTGADDYIVKPFEAEELRARIDNLIESRRMLREQFSREILLQPTAVKITSADEQFLQQVMEVIEANMSHLNFGRDELCKEMHMSPTQLNRKLKALTDHAPVELIRIMRMKRAAALLAAGAGNVGEISFMVGYKDHSYFSRSFHKQYGVTPSEYAASKENKSL